MPDGTGICTALEKFPDRAFDVGLLWMLLVEFDLTLEPLEPPSHRRKQVAHVEEHRRVLGIDLEGFGSRSRSAERKRG